jgi:hypothetical protein
MKSGFRRHPGQLKEVSEHNGADVATVVWLGAQGSVPYANIFLSVASRPVLGPSHFCITGIRGSTMMQHLWLRLYTIKVKLSP